MAGAAQISSEPLLGGGNTEEVFRLFLDHVPSQVAMLDRSFCYMAVSRQWSKATGYLPGELVGKNHIDISGISAEQREMLRRCMAGAVEMRPQDSWIDRQGQMRWFRWEARPWYRAAGDAPPEIGGILITSEEVSDQVQMVERLRASESTLGSFFDTAPFLLGILELRGDDVIFIRANPAIAAILGAPSAEALAGQSPETFDTTPGATDCWRDKLRCARDTGGPVHFDVERRTPAGAVWISATVSPVPADSPAPGAHPRFSFVARDATEQRRSARALEISEERLKLALAATAEGMYDWNIATGNVSLTPRCWEQLGMPRQDEADVGEWISRIHPDDAERLNGTLQAHLAGETPAYVCEHRVRHQAGHYIWILSRGQVVKRDADGKPLRFVGTQLDITNRKHAEEELERAKRAAQEASAAKSAFLANISHEIRTPMTAILGYADLLQEESLSPAERRQFVETIRESGRHLLGLINDVLDLSKFESGRLVLQSEWCDPWRLAQEVATLLSTRAAARGLAFTVRQTDVYPGGPRPLFADPMRTRQILLNLVENAIKFTEKGSVELCLREEMDATGSENAAAAGRCCFDVIDTGIGISAAHLEQLFEPFVQVDSSATRRFGGTGLGLAISRRLAKKMGGGITLRSDEGAGSVFTFWLPMDLAAPPMRPPPAAPLESAVANHSLAGARVLIVEDAAEIQLLVSHVLSRAGAVVEVSADGQAGVNAARAALQAGHPFDLVLMDVQMPMLDGHSATRQMRALGVHAPIIALTADAMDANRVATRAAGSDEFISKPIEIDRFMETVRRVLGRQ